MHSDAAHPNQALAKRLAAIYDLHSKQIDLRLTGSPYLELLAKLGNPQNRLPPVVHLAGTNGKGSTLAFLRAMCEAAGLRVHTYTSPHLITFNERITLAGNPISDDTLITLYERIDALNAGAGISFFEFTTALAFEAFANTPADIVLLETGLGGRLDCTNVVLKPLLSIITQISYDHTHLLGDTLPKIAFEKAGIIKQNCPCLIGPQSHEAEVMAIFEARAAALQAPLTITHVPADLPPLGLCGTYQHDNAATALAAADILDKAGIHIPPDARTQGLAAARWPGRMQPIQTGPLAAMLPPTWDMWFDAAHNPSGAQVLADELKSWKNQNPTRPIHLIIALGANKDATSFFAPLKGTYDTLTFIDLPGGMAPRTATDLKAQTTLNAATAPTPQAALQTLLDTQPNAPTTRICFAGSLYLYQHICPQL